MAGRKKKIYLGIVGLCGLALIVDRIIPMPEFAEPKSILAATPGVVNDVETAPAFSIPQLPFPRNTGEWNRTQHIRDLFAPPSVIQAQLSAASDSGSASEKRPGGPPERGLSRIAFASQYKLNAVLVVENLRVAVLGEKWVRENDVVDGCKLNRISGNFAVFSCYDGSVTLTSGLSELP